MRPGPRVEQRRAEPFDHPRGQPAPRPAALAPRGMLAQPAGLEPVRLAIGAHQRPAPTIAQRLRQHDLPQRRLNREPQERRNRVPLAGQIGQACRQTARWRERAELADLSVSVNLSPRQLREEGLVADVRTALLASGLPAHALILEITESLLVDDVVAATVADLSRQAEAAMAAGVRRDRW